MPSCFLPQYIGPGNDMDLDPLCLLLDEPGADQENYKPTGLEHHNPLVAKKESDISATSPLLAVEDDPSMASIRRLTCSDDLGKLVSADDLAAAAPKQKKQKEQS